MNAVQAESQLAVLYLASAILSAISMISLVVAWQYWAWTLDVCIGIDCGCILYGVNTFNTFMGGDVKLCHFGTYGLIPPLIIGSCLGIYHGYRICIHRNPNRSRSTFQASNYNRNNRDGEVAIVGPNHRSPCKQWIPVAFLAVLISCLSLAHAVVLTDGYYKTCEQYKRNLIQLLGSSGREIQVIHNRLACGAILDFMDYLQPDANNWRRGDEINTGLALQFAIVTSWLHLFSWILVFAINVIMARQRSKHLNEKLCCCC